MTQESLVDKIRADPYEVNDYYAAVLTMNIVGLLQRALESRKDLTLADVAGIIGVPEERVRWAYSLNDLDDIPEGISYRDWNSDGNLSISALARYLRVLGYELDLKVKAVVDEANEDFVNHRPRRIRRGVQRRNGNGRSQQP